jgi:hypothetical protein
LKKPRITDMAIPAGYYKHPVSGYIFQNGTNYGPYVVANDTILGFMGSTLVQAGFRNGFNIGYNGLYYKIFDDSGPFAYNATGIYNFLN